MRQPVTLFTAAVLAAVLGAVSPAAADGPLEKTRITILCNNISFATCADRIAEKNDVRIIVPKALAAREVKFATTDEPLTSVVGKIAALLGMENLVVQYQQQAKSVTLQTLGDANQELAIPTAPAAKSAAAPAARSGALPAVPPAGQPAGQEQDNPWITGDSTTPSSDAVVLPSDTPDGAPITARQLIELENKEQVTIASPDMVVLPPADAESKAVTIREFWKASGPQASSDDMAILPPEDTGGKAVTGGAMAKRLSQEKGMAPDEEVLPPDTPGGKGISIKQLQTAPGGSAKP